MSLTCTGILLAAGQGRRFGANKLLHPLADGTPLALASARTLRSVLAHSIAVVADVHGELAGRLSQHGLHIVANPRTTEGMGTSIACGVAASPAAQGWVIALADMPWVPEPVIRAVVRCLARGADIVAPAYQGRRGHPVGFSARHGEALIQLRGDAGARGIVDAHRASLQVIETG
ncbi:MAG: nucleotidyltransferase family protein, partial [Gammaproteobacteria bacterium]